MGIDAKTRDKAIHHELHVSVLTAGRPPERFGRVKQQSLRRQENPGQTFVMRTSLLGSLLISGNRFRPNLVLREQMSVFTKKQQLRFVQKPTQSIKGLYAKFTPQQLNLVSFSPSLPCPGGSLLVSSYFTFLFWSVYWSIKALMYTYWWYNAARVSRLKTRKRCC